MSYHSIRRLLAYGPEQGHLKRYLEEGFDPYDYSHELKQWLEESVCGECGSGDDPDCKECEGGLRAKVDEMTADGDDPQAWLGTASESDLVRLRDDLEEQKLHGYMGGPSGRDIGPDRPVYEHMSFERLVKPTWLVHFTDDPSEIASEGFKYGWENTEGLGLTTHFTDEARKRGPGFNFAFTLGSRDARIASGSRYDDGPKYGTHAVVFWAGGVEAFHYGDEESQVIFWGPEVPPSRIFALWNGKDDGWYVRNAVDRVVFGVDPDVLYDERAPAKDFEQAAEWAAANHRMLAGTQEGVERVERERAKAAHRT